MKKTTIAGACALMGLLLFSCTKEMNITPPEENTATSGKAVTITATATVAETKTTYVDNAGIIEVNWEASESFKAYTTGYGTGSELTFTKTDDATTQSATFQTTGDVSDGTKLYAVYDPSSKFTGGNTIDLTNAYVTDVNNLKNYDVMFAEGTVSGASVNFAFTHALSFFKVTLNRGSLTAAGNDNDLKLTLVFNNCKKVGGYTYTGCEFNENVLTRTITLAAGDVPAANASTTIYVAMPPLEYEAAVSPVSSGLTASYSKIFALKDGKSIAAGTVYSTSVPFAPNNLQAIFGTPGGNATYTSTYSWTGSTSNLMDVFTFSNGELANYTTLTFTFSNLVDGPVRMGYYVGSSFTEFGNGYYSAGEKTVELNKLGIDLSTVTKISFGGRSNAGSCVIKPSDVILSGNNGTLTASFGTPGSYASYVSYSWTATNNNLMTCYAFTVGELAQYKTLTFKISNFSEGAGMVRMGYYIGSSFTEFGNGYGSAGTKTVDLTALGIDLATVTKISFGGRTGTGSVNIFPSDVILTK